MYRYVAIVALVISVALPLAASAKATRSGYQSAYQKAVAAREKSGKAGNQWTTTADALNAAKKAADSGDYEQAIKYADRAQALARLALEQARDNENNWRKATPD